MKDLICIECGKPVLKDSLCKTHLLGTKKLPGIKGFSVKVCRQCGSFYKGKWKKTSSIEESVMDIVRERLVGIKTKMHAARTGNRIRLRITATSKAGSIKRTEKAVLDVFLSQVLCENCIKLSGGYHEATIQIRGENAGRILGLIRSAADDASVAGMNEVHNGYDVKFLSKDAARKLVRKIAGYEIKRSYKHITTKKGRMIYRDYYSIR